MKITVGIVDYGVGNHASVRHTFRELGMRCRTSDDPATLDDCDLLVLPGVGAFRPAIEALRARSLDVYLVECASRGMPLLGICLGMQLLADSSHENGVTRGLGLVGGEVMQLPAPRWHIGWNTIEVVRPDPLFASANGHAFFFNHSFAYREPNSHAVCQCVAGGPFVAAVRRDNVVGVQFHPEKSQSAGRALLRELARGLVSA
ncbi:MAG: imidazole glycerol phosphate synthase subunit HisH [Steroidobacteraceae bacterium]